MHAFLTDCHSSLDNFFDSRRGHSDRPSWRCASLLYYDEIPVLNVLNAVWYPPRGDASMDAASRFPPLLVVIPAIFSLSSLGLGQDTVQSHSSQQSWKTIAPPTTSNPIQDIADWLGQWITSRHFIKTRSTNRRDSKAITPPIAPCVDGVNAADTSGEAVPRVIEGPLEADEVGEEEPIIEAPVAPPLPRNYQFTFRENTSVYEQPHLLALSVERPSTRTPTARYLKTR
jgi:hypothetical protein